MNTKYKWLARFGLCRTICPKCGAKLNARGYYLLLCTSCKYHRTETFGHFWSEAFDSSKGIYRKDVAIDKFTGEWKEGIQ